MAKFVSQLARVEVAYFNPSTVWACTPLLIQKLDTAGSLFTVDLRLSNSFIVKHQYSMSNLELELTNTARSKCIDLFDDFRRYWQLPLENFARSVNNLLHRMEYILYTYS